MASASEPELMGACNQNHDTEGPWEVAEGNSITPSESGSHDGSDVSSSAPEIAQEQPKQNRRRGWRSRLFDAQRKRSSLFKEIHLQQNDLQQNDLQQDDLQHAFTIHHPPRHISFQVLGSWAESYRFKAKLRAAQKGRAEVAPRPYSPYPTIKSSTVQDILVELGNKFMEVDKFCASYFQAASAYDNCEGLEEFLKNARNTLQNRQPGEVSYIGDLGEFCERVLGMEDPAPLAEFQSRNHTDEAINRYLQDALELPYWEIGLDAFMNWRDMDNNSDVPVYILYMLSYIRTSCREGLQRLRDEAVSSEDQESVEVVAKGIEDRLRLLDSILRRKIKDIGDLDDAVRRKSPPLNASKAFPAGTGNSLPDSQAETTTMLALVFIFLILAIVPGYRGFAIFLAEERKGSIEDADFWYLCQSSVMFLLGSFASALPLLRRDCYKRARNIFWFFFTAGFALAIVSIAIYPGFNTGWSALVSFLASVTTASSLLVLTQATPHDEHEALPQEKLHQD